ncbi:hypothetical protein LSAT2_018415 [Lamellibrachia satsuma]|nr:hypothetical protein LSAT2_018415 [Lamellibrachia satsuma]
MTALKRGVSPIDITAEDFAEMLQRHRKRRLDSEDHPDLDTKNLCLDDILQRAHPGKKDFESNRRDDSSWASGKEETKRGI